MLGSTVNFYLCSKRNTINFHCSFNDMFLNNIIFLLKTTFAVFFISFSLHGRRPHGDNSDNQAMCTPYFVNILLSKHNRYYVMFVHACVLLRPVLSITPLVVRVYCSVHKINYEYIISLYSCWSIFQVLDLKYVLVRTCLSSMYEETLDSHPPPSCALVWCL